MPVIIHSKLPKRPPIPLGIVLSRESEIVVGGKMDTIVATPPPPFLGKILKKIMWIMLLAGILAVAVQHLGGGQSPKIRPNCDPNEVYRLAADERIRFSPLTPDGRMSWQLVRTVEGREYILSELKLTATRPADTIASAISSKGIEVPKFFWVASVNTFHNEGTGYATRLLMESNAYFRSNPSPYPRYFASTSSFTRFIADCSKSITLENGNWLLWP